MSVYTYTVDREPQKQISKIVSDLNLSNKVGAAHALIGNVCDLMAHIIARLVV